MRSKKAEAGSPPTSPRQQALAEWLEEAATEQGEAPNKPSQFQSFLPIIRSMIRSMSDADIDFLCLKLTALTNRLNAVNIGQSEAGEQ